MKDLISFQPRVVYTLPVVVGQGIEGPVSGHWTAALNDAEYDRECATLSQSGGDSFLWRNPFCTEASSLTTL